MRDAKENDSAFCAKTPPFAKARRTGHPHPGRARGRRGLFRFVLLEKTAGLCQIESVAVHDELIFAGVVGDADDSLDLMTVVPEGLDDKVDVYHGAEFTRVCPDGHRSESVFLGLARYGECWRTLRSQQRSLALEALRAPLIGEYRGVYRAFFRPLSRCGVS